MGRIVDDALMRSRSEPVDVAGIVLVRPRGNFRATYTYDNILDAPIDLWVSIPQDGLAQRDIEVGLVIGSVVSLYGYTVGGQVVDLDWSDGLGFLHRPETDFVNVVARFRLQPTERIQLDIRFTGLDVRYVDARAAARLERRGWTTRGYADLTPEERAYYLRSTELVHLRDMDAVAGEFVSHENRSSRTVSEQLQVVADAFDYVSSSRFAYQPSPPERGVAAMLAHHRGDCGEYSFVVAAACRRAGIPARVVIGTWSIARQQSHGWNEVFIDGVGWIPVDATMGRRLRTLSGRVAALLGFPRGLPALMRSKSYLGAIEGSRLGFSIEVEPHGLAGYDESSDPPSIADIFSVRGKRVMWGYRLLAGAVPWLQPAYPRFRSVVQSTDNSLDKGEWRFIMSARDRVLNTLSLVGLLIGVVFLIFSLIPALGVNLTVAQIVSQVGWLLFAGCWYLLDRYRWLNLFGTIFLGISLAVRIQGL